MGGFIANCELATTSKRYPVGFAIQHSATDYPGIVIAEGVQHMLQLVRYVVAVLHIRIACLSHRGPSLCKFTKQRVCCVTREAMEWGSVVGTEVVALARVRDRNGPHHFLLNLFNVLHVSAPSLVAHIVGNVRWHAVQADSETAWRSGW